MEPNATAVVLVAAGALLLLAGLSSGPSERLGVPTLLLFLVLGMVAGSEGLGGIAFDDYGQAYRLGTIALVLILFDGGLNTSVPTMRRAAGRATVLATIGVIATAAMVAGVTIWLGFPPALAVLVGSVVSSTDAAAVFAVLRGGGVRLEPRTAATIEVESGLNDPMAIVLTIVATDVVLGHRALDATIAVLLLQQFGIGAIGGVVAGWLGRRILNVTVLPAPGLYPVLTVALAFAIFGGITLIGGSGFLAVYLAAIVLGDGPVPYRASVRRVHDGLAWLSQVGMFVMLGLLVFPSRLLPLAGDGLVLAAVLAFVARPLAVLLCLAPFRATWPERTLVAWVGLRGAVPIVLATYPVLMGVADGDRIFHLVFFIVLANAIVPGATVVALARRLGLAAPATRAPQVDVELVARREYAGSFVWYHVAAASAVAGALVRELPLPAECVLTIVLRGAEVVAPRGDVRLAEGDAVCVFVTAEHRPLLDLLFAVT